MTTKAQEREALAKIKAILDTLEEDSYVNTAFNGVVSDAEFNIENDAAFSMMDRYTKALDDYKKSESRNSELTLRVSELEFENKALCAECERTKGREISKETIKTAYKAVYWRLCETQDSINDALDAVSEHVDNPDGDHFTEAVKEYKARRAAFNVLDSAYKELSKFR